MGLLDTIRRRQQQFVSMVKGIRRLREDAAFIRQALGRIEARQTTDACTLAASEFKVSSQWGEDGILQFLIRHITVPRTIFVEFGVQDYTESNTRFLLSNNNWSGLVLDGSEENIRHICQDTIYWRHNLKAVRAFITRENIDDLLTSAGLAGEIGLLSVDIDGVDYWVWEAITVVQPAIVVAEYNSLFGAERAVTVPYDAAFVRSEKHHSNLYYGASLSALVRLANRKGMAFVGTNSAGNNAFFVRRELLVPPMREITAAEGFTQRKFREGRNETGELSYLSAEQEAALIASLALVEIHP